MIEDEKLKEYMLEHFDFDVLKKAGFFGKEIKRKDYHAQAERVKWFFGFDSIYDYDKEELRCHLSYTRTKPKPLTITPHEPFIHVSFPKDKKEAKIIPFL